MKNLILLAVLACGVLPLVACGQAPTAADTIAAASATPSTTTTTNASAVTTPRSRPTGSPDRFVAQIEGRGIRVERLAEAQQPFLRAIGSRQRLQGGPLANPVEVQIYAYDQSVNAAADAARVQPDTTARWADPDGNVRTMSFVWSGPPHFFLRATVLVFYVGADPAALALLGDLLGPQFAGRP